MTCKNDVIGCYPGLLKLAFDFLCGFVFV